jgi:hypothetical protein
MMWAASSRMDLAASDVGERCSHKQPEEPVSMSFVLQHIHGPDAAPTAALRMMPDGGDSVSTTKINAAVHAILARSRSSTTQNWLQAVGRLALDLRPDIGNELVQHLRVLPLDIGSPLEGLSIGEIGVVYEALMALSDHRARKIQGQFFTPDDVAANMAVEAARFPAGNWLDPCCGVGNLSWHLAKAMPDPGDFVADRLTLIDFDKVALNTAIVLLVANFANAGDREALPKLVARSHRRDFLQRSALPEHDYVIANPPYAATAQIDRFRTAKTRELYAYFLERIVTESRGFIAITPASFLGAAKYSELRRVLEERVGGTVMVFDNVPDTCFRGYKYGSTNSSTTNFVRAAITVSSPLDIDWKVTPILRWAARSRRRMWRDSRDYFVPLRKGPSGEWAKVMPGTEQVWDQLADSTSQLGDLVSTQTTSHVLEVASTPRYYISASKRSLDRGSKHTLYFANKSDLNRAFILLNSSLPYWWWRCLDGGITLPIRNLLSLPIPKNLEPDEAIVAELESSDRKDVVTKLNAGRQNENVRRSRALVEAIDASLLEEIDYNFRPVYAPDMFDERDRNWNA